jgi:Uma2 family endonuclease
MNFSIAELPLPVRVRPETPMTDEELARFCSANEALRVERDSKGELIVMSPTWTEGGGKGSEVGGELFVWSRADGRGKYYDSSTGFRLPDTSIRAADAHWVSWARWNALLPEQRKGFARICPEFVIEVRSETDRLRDMHEKMKMWIDNGAELAWLIDPERKVVEVYRPGEEPEIHHDPTSVQGTGPVRGFELVMARVWG